MIVTLRTRDHGQVVVQKTARRKARTEKAKPVSARNATPAQSPDASPLVQNLIALAAMLAITVLAYLPALQGGFVWDDDANITRPALQSLHGLWRIWFDPRATAQYYPLVHTAFWIEHHIFGDTVLGYHLMNVCMHAVSAFLVFMIVRQLSLPGAWIAGAVFALHPVHVESVAWITEQKNTLSTVLSLGAVLAYLHLDKNQKWRSYWLATGLFVLALLAKTIAATVPPALLIVLWWRYGRLNWRKNVVPLLPWFALGALAGFFTEWVEKTIIGAQGSEFSLSLLQKLLLAGRAWWFYIGKLLWPSRLTFNYPHWEISPGVWWQYIFPIGVLIVFAVALAFALRQRRGPLATFLIYSLTLAPALGFLNVYYFRYSYVADHFQYVASLAIIVSLSCLYVTWMRRYRQSETAIRGFAAALLLALAVLTWRQAATYRDAETLYRATLERNPNSWMTYNNLGNVMAQDPDHLPDAIHEFQISLKMKPDNAEAHLNLGSALGRTIGHLPESINQFRTALQLRPRYADAHFDLAVALSHQGQMSEAIAEYQAALKIDPDLPQAHNNLGNLLAQTPDGIPDAIAHYNAALRENPGYVEARFNLGRTLALIPGKKDEAIKQFQLILQTRPDFQPAMDAIRVLSTGQ